MLAILKREIKSYFHNVIGWLCIAALVALYGLYFWAYNLQAGYPYIAYGLSGMSYILLIAVPILSMRTLAEERKNKVDQLLLTAPVSVGKIVLAKYLGLVAVFSVAMLIIAISPIVLSTFGTVPLGESCVALLGFWLMGCTFLAIGLFVSSITESQIIAAVVAFAVLFACYTMSSITMMISSEGNWITSVLSVLDIYTPFESFLNGVLNLSSVFYYVSFSGFILFITVQSIQKRRWSVSKNTVSASVFSTSSIAIALVVAIVGNLAVNALPVTFKEIDCTYSKMYELTEATENFVKELEEDIKIYVLASESQRDEQVNESLQRYQALSDHISIEYVDPSVNPYFYQNYTDTAPNQNSVIVEGSKRAKVIDYYELYELEYSLDYTTYSYTYTPTGYDVEGQITSALEYVTMDNEELAVVYEITGHGETALTSSFTDVLAKANIRLEALELFNEEGVPADAQAVIINGPTSDFNEEDAKKVISYLEAGGNVLITCNYELTGMNNFKSILAAYQVEVVDGIVAENDAQHYYNGNPLYLLPDVNSTVYTTSVTNAYIFSVYSVGLSFPETDEEEESVFTYESMLETSDSAVSKVDIYNITTSEYEEGDVQGGFSLGVAVNKQIEEETVSQLVVLGSSMIFTEDTNSMVSGSHAAMFTDIISEMTTETELSSSVIPVKELSLSNLTIDTMAALSMAFVIIIVLPLGLLATGISIWFIRRKK